MTLFFFDKVILFQSSVSVFSFLFSAPLVTATVSCNLAGPRLRRLTNTKGIIQTYDGYSYRHNIDCRWKLTSNTLLQLQFATFTTYSSADYLTVYDGDSLSAPLIGNFSGNFVPPLITSSTNKLYVRFKTDRTGSRYGFKAHYRGKVPFLKLDIRR